jgi:hypothetical protein
MSKLSDLNIEFLFIDLSRCTRCQGTDTSLEEALAETASVLRATGVEVTVQKIHVQTEEQARESGFVSSPTIRINGRDIQLGAEVKESLCESCGGVCGEEGIGCRVWMYQGKEYTAAPKAMIIDAILREVYGGANQGTETPRQGRDLSENLQRFFAAKQRKERGGESTCGSRSASAKCCD